MTNARHRRWPRTRAGFALALVLYSATAPAARPRPKPKPPVPSQPGEPAPAPAPAPVHAAGPVAVTVIQVAGTQAYLQPGEKAGVRRGAKVVIDRKEYPVVQSTSSFAVIEVGDQPVHEQDRGQATAVGEQEEKATELPKPRPTATWQNAWAPEAAPADTQTPKFVPLGGGAERDRRLDVRLSMAVGSLLPLGQRGGPITSAEINARIHAEPLQAPAAFDLDLSLQNWFAGNLATRNGSQARPILFLREMLFSYGAGGWNASFGRMRYAASTLGTLDGARVRAPLGGGLSIGAFGGFLPNPLGGEPAVDAQRFGVEATYSRPELELRPEAALVIHGSTFGGSLDERRISGVVGLYPGLARFGGHFEVSGFDSNNPWKASPFALTAAGFDASVHKGIFELGGRFDLQQPDRSRWLASYLPLTWFCRTVAPPAPPGMQPGPDVCDGSVSTRGLGTVDAGITVDRLSLIVGGTTMGDLTQTGGAPHMLGGFASGRVVRIAKVARVEASASYSRATYMNMFGGSIGPGVTLLDDNLDLSAYYRNATLEYRSVSSTSLVQNAVGGTVLLFPSSVLLFTLQGEAVEGSDVQALLLFGTVMWRPRF